MFTSLRLLHHHPLGTEIFSRDSSVSSAAVSASGQTPMVAAEEEIITKGERRSARRLHHRGRGARRIPPSLRCLRGPRSRPCRAVAAATTLTRSSTTVTTLLPHRGIADAEEALPPQHYRSRSRAILISVVEAERRLVVDLGGVSSIGEAAVALLLLVATAAMMRWRRSELCFESCGLRSDVGMERQEEREFLLPPLPSPAPLVAPPWPVP